MFTQIKSLFALLVLTLCAAFGLNAQQQLLQTTLSTSVPSTSQRVIQLASTTGLAGPSLSTGLSYQLYIDDEVLDVQSVSGSLVTVRRGANGTRARFHASGANVYIASAALGAMIDYPLAGSCPNGTYPATPMIDYFDAQTYVCSNGQWVIATVAGSQHYPSDLFLTTTYTNATTTYSNVTGLSFPVSANHQYTASCTVVYQASATTLGPKFQLTGPASPTTVLFGVDGGTGATTYGDAAATAFSSGISLANAGAATTNYVVHLFLTLLNGSNAGTVQIQAAATSAGTITIQPGSGCIQN